MEYVQKLPFSETLFDLEKIKKQVALIDEYFNKADDESLSDEERDSFYEQAETLRENEINNYSVYLCAEEMKKTFPLEENQLYDVTKIYISEKTYETMKAYDKESFKIFHDDIFSEEKVAKEIMWLHFNSGFCVDSKAEDFTLYLKEGFIR